MANSYFYHMQSYDGGFGMVPGSESHGGGTFCAVAALHLMGFVQVDLASNLRDSASIDMGMLLEWCLQRQVTDGGFQGRRNKPSDTCYAFLGWRCPKNHWRLPFDRSLCSSGIFADLPVTLWRLYKISTQSDPRHLPFLLRPGCPFLVGRGRPWTPLRWTGDPLCCIVESCISSESD